ncbi:unnamed protein product [Phaedon cochleariae]|uniref:Uncharacterized protein n=1 Tax=Phaedon cochleariae TaxID=80249 RepID=A0A9N9SKF1_PHACE|nr:unnamed protein product [Phaedon cochleariae]
MNSIETLLEAAEYIARREREAEHGYASTLRFPDDLSRGVCRRPKSKKSQGNRTSHNELEKNSSAGAFRLGQGKAERFAWQQGQQLLQ